MQIENGTPFRHFVFPQVDKERRERACVLIKAEYQIVPRTTCQLKPDAPPVVFTDQYYGDPKSSSLRVASDLAYYKPCTDIVFVDPVGVTPGGEMSRQWQVAVNIGRISFKGEIFGPRHWYRSLTGRWRLSEPEHVDSVPIRFENAFGGKTDGWVFRENPVGVGFCPANELAKSREVRAPQCCWNASDVVHLNGSNLRRPFGLTPISPGWLPRLKYAGTFDESWKSNDWPNWPNDFLDSFFLFAPEHLQYPGFVRGGEHVTLDGFSRERTIDFYLPEVEDLMFRGFFSNNKRIEKELHLDSVIIDLNGMSIQLCWRTSVVPPSHCFYAQILSSRDLAVAKG